MKGLIAGLVAGAALGGAGVAGATSSWWHSNGVVCKGVSSGAVCLPDNGRGYGVGISPDFVFVYDLSNSRRVFTRLQPSRG